MPPQACPRKWVPHLYDSSTVVKVGEQPPLLTRQTWRPLRSLCPLAPQVTTPPPPPSEEREWERPLALETQQHTKQPEPRGLGEHTRGLASEYAHEQGWGLNEDQRTELPEGKQNTGGGTDYDYGARDFGDEPVDTSSTQSADIDKVRELLQKGNKQ